jgi:hypothetical protein
MSILAGYQGFVTLTVNTTPINLHATRWTVDSRVDAIDVSTFINNDYGIYIDGVGDYDVSIDLIYDSNQDPWRVAPLLTPGVTASAVLFLVEAHANLRYTIPHLLFTEVRMEDAVRDVVRWSVRARANNLASASAVTLPAL